jgi:hypothetical protein
VLSSLFDYVSPEALLPVACFVGAVGGVITIIGRTIYRVASRSIRFSATRRLGFPEPPLEAVRDRIVGSGGGP